jgi:chitodextrinase
MKNSIVGGMAHPCLTLSFIVAASALFLLSGCGGGGSYSPPPIQDTTPPTTPANLVATAVSAAQIGLSWTASTDNVGVAGYKVERCQGAGCANFSQIATPTGTTFNDSGLTGATSYSYRVRATDAAGNLSSYSTTANVSTPVPMLTTPSNFTATAVSSTQINLSWTASTETGGTVGSYIVQRCQGAGCQAFGTIGGPATTTFNDTGLTPSTSYSYVVVATDALGNRSSTSTIATASTPAPGAISVSVTPKRAGVTTSQPQQFTATVTGDLQNLGVTWSVDGTNGGGTTSGTISAAGLYTPSSSTTAGAHTIVARSVADNTQNASVAIAVTDLGGVLTFQNDVQRTGQNLQEYALNSSTVTAATFGSLFSCSVTEGGAVPGHVYAQPLYVANLTMADNKKHNVVFVVTESDFVYAFDADANPCVQLWKAPMLSVLHGASAGETTVPAGDTGEPDDVHPEIGITSTPVIDPTTNTIYLCAKSKDTSANYHLRLHALSLVTGLEQASSPVEISTTGFTPLFEAQRPALLLSGTNVYLGFGSHGDNNSYHGFLLGYDKTSLAQKFVWSATDITVGSTKGAIWQSGAGPAVDSSGNIWVEIANGDFDTATPRINMGDSVVRLNPALVAPASPVVDFFTPQDQLTLAANDIDLGSGGVTILPPSVGSATHQELALATGKTDLLYLLDQNNLGQFTSSGPDNIVQEVTLFNGLNESNVIGGMFSKAAYFNGRIYVVPISDVLRAYTISNATLTAVPATGADTFGFPGATPSVSAPGATANGIVWVLNTTNNNSENGSGTSGPAQLFGYDAASLSQLFNGSASATAVKFTVPTVANGKVYVGGQGAITVFGLLPN